MSQHLIFKKQKPNKKRGQRIRQFKYGYEVCPQCREQKYEQEYYWWKSISKNRVPVARVNGAKDQSKRLVCSPQCRECFRQNAADRRSRKLNDQTNPTIGIS